jgi:hypothetical protein
MRRKVLAKTFELPFSKSSIQPILLSVLPVLKVTLELGCIKEFAVAYSSRIFSLTGYPLFSVCRTTALPLA